MKERKGVFAQNFLQHDLSSVPQGTDLDSFSPFI